MSESCFVNGGTFLESKRGGVCKSVIILDRGVFGQILLRGRVFVNSCTKGVALRATLLVIKSKCIISSLLHTTKIGLNLWHIYVLARASEK